MEDLTIDLILSAFLVFVRVSALIMTAPYFSTSAFPRQIKIYWAIVTTVVLYSAIPAEGAFISASSGTVFIVVAILLEVLIGFALGLVGQIIFAGLEMAGMLISMNTALSFASMIDTMTQQQTAIISNLLTMVGVLVFLSIDGDKVYISALAKSFQVIPVNQVNIAEAGPNMLRMATYLFVIGVQVASPFIIVVFLIDLSLAIFGRIMPQANLMFIAMPIKIGVGLSLMMVVIPYLPATFDMIFQHLYDYLVTIMEAIQPV